MLTLSEIEFAMGRIEAAVRSAQDAAEYFRTNGQLTFLLYPLVNLSAYSLGSSRYEEAHKYACEALLLARKIGQPEETLVSLQHLAAVAILDDDRRKRDAPILRRAANILGFADESLIKMGLTRDATTQQEYDKIIMVLREAVGEGAAEKLMAAGKQWTEDQAVAEALAI
jgi:hypothetical protein